MHCHNNYLFLKLENLNTMKRSFFFVFSLLIGLSCQSPKEQSAASTEETIPGEYGEKLNSSAASTVKEMFGQLKKGRNFQGKVTAEIQEVCTKKGCWLTVALPDGNLMRVTFKDYGFFVPTTSEGYPIILEGLAQKTVTDVETLRHYAEDAGKPKQEIEAITQPKEEFTFEATGVIIKEKV
jgi:hypothetical protein